ncbi:hypothetical protein [Nocardia nova]|uniref:hypothetical protein n=1 Tax=Nocardia nova TaxID=37330 RepID=UPI002739A784|nr:hypothetical protein [Nocardia nova]
MMESIFVELKQLRRGHGLRAPDVVERIGPGLCRVCGIAPHDSTAEARRKLALKITQECSRLPEPLGRAAVVALALDNGSNHASRRFLHQRVQQLATTFDRDPRTAIRRIDQAFSMLAELMSESASVEIDDSGAKSDDGWYTESLTATLRLDEDPVRLIEERRIVATADELDEIVLSWSVSADSSCWAEPRRLSAEIAFGGRIIEETLVGRSHADFLMRLPEPIGLGQHHDYTAVISAGPRQSIRPYYIVTPWRTCKFFRLRIRFGQETPKSIWRINGLPPAAVTDLEPTGDEMQFDSLGEVQLDFHNLRIARSYGIGWR